MISWLYAAAISAAILAYWLICRKNALKYQMQVVELLETYLADEKLSEKEKVKISLNYKLFRYWFAMPLATLLAPFVIIYAFLSNKIQPDDLPKENSEEFNNFFKVLMQMYMARNPIIATVSMSIFGVVLTLSMVVGTVFHKASKIPSYTALASSIIAKMGAIRLRHHPSR